MQNLQSLERHGDLLNHKDYDLKRKKVYGKFSIQWGGERTIMFKNVKKNRYTKSIRARQSFTVYSGIVFLITITYFSDDLFKEARRNEWLKNQINCRYSSVSDIQSVCKVNPKKCPIKMSDDMS